MTSEYKEAVAEYVSECLQLALLLEVSAYPKPGNVHRMADSSNTCYEQYLASSVALFPHLRFAAERGVNVSKGKISLDEVGIGKSIKDSAEDMIRWQRGGNTHIGAVILLMPIAVASGLVLSKGRLSLKELRQNIQDVIVSTTPEDAVEVYEAIRKANPGGLGKVPELDINDPRSKKKILRESISLYQIFKSASKYDTICSEWTNKYPITFDFAYPFLKEQIERRDDLNAAIVHTFLKILAEYPDTLISRKTHLQKSIEVSFKAKEILKLGGLETSSGRRSLARYDQELRRSGNLLNPGATADITAAAISLCILEGYRP